MAHYGNILIVYDSGSQHLQEVKGVLEDNKADYEQVEASFLLRPVPWTIRAM